jgi:tetratricopeptide (TPR) repeat protein
MKICPLLWRSTSPSGGQDDPAGFGSVQDGAPPDCIGVACRFNETDGSCSLERLPQALGGIERRLAESEERWESVLLSLVELTERVEAALAPIQEHRPGLADGTSGASSESAREEAQIFNQEGIAHYHGGAHAEARECFLRAIEVHPGFVEAYNNLGLAETELGQIEAATEHFRKAIELAPDLAASYTNLGYVHYLRKDYAAAAGMYEEAIRRAENSSVAWTNLGNAYFKLGHLQKARAAWDRAVTLDPDNAKAARNLAQIPQTVPA